MATIPRRRFLRQASVVAAGASLAAAAPASIARGANDRIVLGAIGCGGRGTGVARAFAELPDVKVAWVCDPDAAH